MANDVLVSPLGRAPGAVSGVYFALKQRRTEIGKVITVGTSHPHVRKAADSYLGPLFRHCGVVFDPVHVPALDLRGGSKEVMPYVAMIGWALEEAQRYAQQHDGQVHVAVTGGRSGMGALAALATNLYGADHLWHLWVRPEIEEGGTVDNLTGLNDPVQMERSPYLNPTVEADACEIVDLPFLDLRPLHPVLREYRRTGKISEATHPLASLFAHHDIQSFTQVFPAGLTFAAADEIMALKARYVQATTDRGREKVMIELGRTLERAGVVEKDDRQRMMDLVSGRADPQALIDLGKKAKDRIGFWKWLAENKRVPSQ